MTFSMVTRLVLISTLCFALVDLCHRWFTIPQWAEVLGDFTLAGLGGWLYGRRHRF